MISSLKKWLFSGLLCLMLLPSGCKPEGIIPSGDMETLFAEFYLSDACIESMNAVSGSPTFRPDSLRVYQPVIEKHGFTEDEFRTSLAYYLHRPSDMTKIFKHVHVRLEQEADRRIERVDIEEEEVEEEEAGQEKEDGSETKQPKGIVKEGVEPEIEREPGDLPKVKPAREANQKTEQKAEQKAEQKPETKIEPKPERKPDPKPSRKRKKMTKEELKRLEEGLK